tara:strand:+ start:1153 stop:1677 length:525 start_codon:yes stop_codon:yes gene_type:complete
MSINFNIEESKKINGLVSIKPSINYDSRGNIWTSFLKKEIECLLPEGSYFNHDKFSESKKNVLRGIHGDNKSWKLVTCVFGDIDQVIVDCRANSPTYYQWEKYNINSKNRVLLLIPPGMGNAYHVKSEIALYHYKLAYSGIYYDADQQFSLKWNDPKINIDWSVKDPILSDRDR